MRASQHQWGHAVCSSAKRPHSSHASSPPLCPSPAFLPLSRPPALLSLPLPAQKQEQSDFCLSITACPIAGPCGDPLSKLRVQACASCPCSHPQTVSVTCVTPVFLSVSGDVCRRSVPVHFSLPEMLQRVFFSAQRALALRGQRTCWFRQLPLGLRGASLHPPVPGTAGSAAPCPHTARDTHGLSGAPFQAGGNTASGRVPGTDVLSHGASVQNHSVTASNSS